MKKDGGTITNWQIHTLSFSKEQIEVVYPGQELQPLIMTGTVVDDPTGRWMPGYHMRSSLIRSIDREKGIIETLNTIYKMSGEEGTDVVPDLGNGVLNITY